MFYPPIRRHFGLRIQQQFIKRLSTSWWPRAVKPVMNMQPLSIMAVCRETQLLKFYTLAQGITPLLFQDIRHS